MLLARLPLSFITISSRANWFFIGSRTRKTIRVCYTRFKCSATCKIKSQYLGRANSRSKSFQEHPRAAWLLLVTFRQSINACNSHFGCHVICRWRIVLCILHSDYIFSSASRCARWCFHVQFDRFCANNEIIVRLIRNLLCKHGKDTNFIIFAFACRTFHSYTSTGVERQWA